MSLTIPSPAAGTTPSTDASSTPGAEAQPLPPRTYQVRTFGCQMNVHDSERMAGLLEQAGFEPTADATDADSDAEDADSDAQDADSTDTKDS